jgi:hypothetical protein
MSKRIAIALLAAIALATLACGVAEGPREKLKHSAFSFNEGLRWGRYNEVLPRVDPETRDHFMELHQGWGKDIRISNAEMLQTVVDDKNEKAQISVKFTWYRIDEMVECETITVQHWERRDGEWLMIAEEHQSGTPF